LGIQQVMIHHNKAPKLFSLLSPWIKLITMAVLRVPACISLVFKGRAF
jgi:hypothetical protein